jgi:hypothetical protein
MKQLFAWQGMKSAVQQFVKACRVCQQAKPDRSKLPGKLQPLPVPSGTWQTVSLDFVEGLPTFGHANCILVVIDSFTKYGQFIALHHPFTALSVAKLFLHNIYKLHGMPLAIVSYRDIIFNINLWKELFALAGVQLQMSSSYHPQSDGQTERLNQTMETFLRCSVNACPSKWLHWLSLAEFWYNSSTHAALSMSPFEALYGYKRVEALQPVQPVELSVWMNEKKLMTTLIKQHLSRAKLCMKKQADKLRSERTFAVDDQVFLKFQPYVQTSLAPRSIQKLAFKFFGPFRIVERIGQVAYKLQLPASSSIHPVFHVCQLKKAITAADEVIDYFPDDLNSSRVPEAILPKRVVHHENSPVHQVLIKWSGWPAALATSEDFTALKQQFPHAPAWGQAVSQEGEIVTTVPATEGNTVCRSSRRSNCPRPTRSGLGRNG